MAGVPHLWNRKQGPAINIKDHSSDPLPSSRFNLKVLQPLFHIYIYVYICMYIILYNVCMCACGADHLKLDNQVVVLPSGRLFLSLPSLVTYSEGFKPCGLYPHLLWYVSCYFCSARV